MQEERREGQLCRSVFMGEDDAAVIRAFTACWIALISRMEAEAAATPGADGAGGESR